MKQDKLSWYIADKQYVNYLRKFDDKVENIEYEDRLKPYLGILITINEHDYYVPIIQLDGNKPNLMENICIIDVT